jgi:hypothetical protein
MNMETIAASPDQQEKARRKRNNTRRNLTRAGFDLSWYNRSTGYYHVKCSQCEALCINGTATHETGCPNARRSR